MKVEQVYKSPVQYNQANDQLRWLVNLHRLKRHIITRVSCYKTLVLPKISLEKCTSVIHLSFNLSISTRTFSKILVVAIAWLRQAGLQIYQYLDDLLLVARFREQAVKNLDFTLFKVNELGWLINYKKIHLLPSQTLLFSQCTRNNEIKLS